MRDARGSRATCATTTAEATELMTGLPEGEQAAAGPRPNRGLIEWRASGCEYGTFFTMTRVPHCVAPARYAAT